jgi:hypothetical protein
MYALAYRKLYGKQEKALVIETLKRNKESI